MITLNNFINFEGNSFTKATLLEAVKNIQTSTIESEEFSFNIYSVTIYPKQSTVIITDDICPDDNPPITIPLSEFIAEIEKIK